MKDIRVKTQSELSQSFDYYFREIPARFSKLHLVLYLTDSD